MGQIVQVDVVCIVLLNKQLNNENSYLASYSLAIVIVHLVTSHETFLYQKKQKVSFFA